MQDYEQNQPCPEDRCPLCWYEQIDSMKADGEDYCTEHLN